MKNLSQSVFISSGFKENKKIGKLSINSNVSLLSGCAVGNRELNFKFVLVRRSGIVIWLIFAFRFLDVRRVASILQLYVLVFFSHLFKRINLNEMSACGISEKYHRVRF